VDGQGPMSNRSLMLILVALSLIVAMVAGIWLQSPAPSFTPRPVLNAMVGTSPPRPLPAMASVDAQGVRLAFNARITRPTVISFWATWCPPCLRELPSFGPFKAQAAAAGIDVLTVSEDKGGASLPVALLAEKGLSFLPLVIDANGALAEALGVRGMPTTLIVDGKGEEIARMEGEADWSQKSSLDAVIRLLGNAASP